MRTRILGALALSLAACQSPPPSPSPQVDPPPRATQPSSAAVARDDAPAPPPTTLEAVLAGTAPVGAPLTAEVLVWPESLIETSVTRGGEPVDVRQYLLVTALDTPEAEAALALAADIEAALPELDALLTLTTEPAPRRQADREAREQRIAELFRRYDALVDRFERIRPPSEDLIALRLARLDAEEVGVKWGEVMRTHGGLTLPSVTVPPIHLQPLPRPIFTFEAAEARLAEIEAQDPPDMAEPLPRLDGIYVDTYDRKAVARYNALVRRLNAEIDRRARFVADAAHSATRRMAFVLRRGLFRKHTLAARVAEAYPAAADTWRLAAGRPGGRFGAPRAFLEEVPGTEITWAQRIATGTDVFVATVPTAADVAVDGRPMGKTPLVLEALPPGARPELTFTHPAHDPYVEPFDIRPRHQGIQLVDRTLPRTRP